MNIADLAHLPFVEIDDSRLDFVERAEVVFCPDKKKEHNDQSLLYVEGIDRDGLLTGGTPSLVAFYGITTPFLRCLPAKETICIPLDFIIKYEPLETRGKKS